MLLSVSSLAFRIPQRRIKDGSRLWPEARWHAILFATRHLACMAVHWYEQRHALSPIHSLNLMIVFVNMAAADAINSMYRQRGTHSNYVRDMDTKPWVKFLFSSVQIGGTCFCVVGQRRYSFHFLAVFVVQFSAFMMTLRRKNMMSHAAWVATYGCILLLAGVAALVDLVRYRQWRMVVLTNFSAVLRCVYGIDKYALWGGMALMLAIGRSGGEADALFRVGDTTLAVLVAVSYVAWLAGAISKGRQWKRTTGE